MPTLLIQGVDPSDPRTRYEKERRLRRTLRYCARVMTVTEKPEGPVTLIERSVLWVVQHVGSPGFQNDPDIPGTTDNGEVAS